jgi:sulfur carrier protein
MRLTLNGKSTDVPDATTVAGLLAELGFGERPVLVELNRHALFPREFADARVKEGDEIEIIELAAGG